MPLWVHDPELILLDELTSGLDPAAKRRICAFIRTLKQRGKTIVLTTHDMEEAEHLCDRIAFMHRGHMACVDTPDRLLATMGQDGWIAFSTDPSFKPDGIKAIPGVQRIEQIDHRVTAREDIRTGCAASAHCPSHSISWKPAGPPWMICFSI